MPNYLDATHDLYKDAAEQPNQGLCCTMTPIWRLPELAIPKIMLEMNYGCGSTVHPRDLSDNPRILYVGIGGGMELLQFSYFNRQKGGVIGVDIVDAMLEACEKNMITAELENPWFQKDFVEIHKGSALKLPIEDESIDVAAQNCLFNIFKQDDLVTALKEMFRVLKPNGKLVLSDPVCNQEMPESLLNDDKLRAECLSGSIPLQTYLELLASVGFGTIEVRGKRPYRILHPKHYDTKEAIYIESVEVAAIKDPMPEDGACVFTGKTAIYTGTNEYFDDNEGHILMYNMPLSICDKTANNLKALNDEDIYISESTWFYDGGGCC